MQSSNPKLTFLSIKTIHRDYFPMFSLKTVRNMIIQNVPHCKLGNKILVKKSELDNYISTLSSNITQNE